MCGESNVRVAEVECSADALGNLAAAAPSPGRMVMRSSDMDTNQTHVAL